MNRRRYRICISGGGASGMAAAAAAGGADVCLIEKNTILGRKVMATGGGRCNITNDACGHKSMTLDFFKSLGLETYMDGEGRYYPYSNMAGDVVKVLADRIEEKGVHVITGTEITSIKKKGDIFLVSCGKDIIEAENLILATGGKSYPSLGTTGDGYRFARDLGHTVEKTYPVLTAVECGDLRDVRGVRARGLVRLLKDGREIASEAGEIQFNEDGISGICVMDLTMHIRSEKGEKVADAMKRYSLSLDLAPDFTEEEIRKRSSSFGILSEKLAKRVGIDEIKDMRLPVKGVKGWKNAQCTGGGVSLGEVDMETQESLIVPGLYITGEVLDYQERCGGYNLQNAWETGLRAAAHIDRKRR